jgi:hypothetical protein
MVGADSRRVAEDITGWFLDSAEKSIGPQNGGPQPARHSIAHALASWAAVFEKLTSPSAFLS